MKPKRGAVSSTLVCVYTEYKTRLSKAVSADPQYLLGVLEVMQFQFYKLELQMKFVKTFAF